MQQGGNCHLFYSNTISVVVTILLQKRPSTFAYVNISLNAKSYKTFFYYSSQKKNETFRTINNTLLNIFRNVLTTKHLLKSEFQPFFFMIDRYYLNVPI